MAEPLKEMYHEPFLRGFAGKVKAAYPRFDSEAFVQAVLGTGWEGLELKERIRRIALSLGGALPADYAEALAILGIVADDCRGFPYLFFPDFVETFGLEHWELSVSALEKFTALSSAEFAVRPFLLKDLPRMMEQMTVWSRHQDEHVRRLASEGCRPRLPWAVAIPALKKDPSPILPILEQLKEDPSEYVRRSVANNLNDISKDHPELVIGIAEAWIGKDENTDKIVRHGCRGLLRAANPAVMALFGMAPQPGIADVEWAVSPNAVPIGSSVDFRYSFRAPEGEAVKLRVELAAYFPRTAGRSYRKLFKLSEKVVPGGAKLQGGRSFSYADLSTRRHYPGEHRLALVVNGEEVATASVELLAKDGEKGGEGK